MSKIYPYCRVCGGSTWEDWGGRYGGLPQVSYARCAGCGATLGDLYGGHLSVILLVRGIDFPDDWINEVVLAVMRRRQHEADVWRDKVFAEVLYIAFGVRRLPETWIWEDDERERLNAAKRVHHAATGENPDTFEGLVLPPPMLPRVPPREVAWVWARARGEEVWTLLDPKQTRDLPLPVDPIREDSDAFWAALDAWHAASGFPVPERQGIENQYSRASTRLEPWYRWKHRHVEVTVGPRKRVYSLTFLGVGPHVVEKLRALAEADAVTFDVDADSAVTIHAWGGGKVREYLRVVYEAVDAG